MTHAPDLINRPAWIDLATSDAAAARDFYEQLFGWRVEVNSDPQYGGYGLAMMGDHSAAGIGPTQSAGQPAAWSLYIGTNDVDRLAQQVGAAGGTVVAPPFDVGDQGRMAVFQDPTGAFISGWQGSGPSNFVFDEQHTFGWTELNTRDVDRAIQFYQQVFGWSAKRSPIGEGAPPYTEFTVDGQTVAGAWEMDAQIPAEVPPYWLIYFSVDDVDGAVRRALELGASEIVAPQEFPGGRFAIVSDPQGATFGLLNYRGPTG